MSLPKSGTIWRLFAEAVRPEFFAELQERLGLQARGFYSLAVVVWLMMWQRLDGRGTLAAAVEQLGQGMLGDMVPPEKRVREERVSTHTGGYCRARQRLPQWCAEAVCDRIFAYLMQTADTPEVLRRWFLLDGSSMRLPHTRSLLQKYPPTRNQHGQSHWPVIRLAMAHHLGTGLALRPCWGAMNGAEAVSEQGLAEELIRRKTMYTLPAGIVCSGGLPPSAGPTVQGAAPRGMSTAIHGLSMNWPGLPVSMMAVRT